MSEKEEILVKCYLPRTVISNSRHQSPIFLSGTCNEEKTIKLNSKNQTRLFTFNSFIPRKNQNESNQIGVFMNTPSFNEEISQSLRTASKKSPQICILINKNELNCLFYYEYELINSENVKFLIFFNSEDKFCLNNPQSKHVKETPPIKEQINEQVKR
jgi:hypothetical protein